MVSLDKHATTAVSVNVATQWWLQRSSLVALRPRHQGRTLAAAARRKFPGATLPSLI